MTGRARGERSRGGIRVAVAWFPADEYERALAAWPELAGEWETVPHAEYCRRLETDMRELTAHGLRPGWRRPLGELVLEGRPKTSV